MFTTAELQTEPFQNSSEVNVVERSPESDCVSNNFLFEPAVGRRTMNAVAVGGKNRKNYETICKNLNFIAASNSKIFPISLFPPPYFWKATELWNYWDSFGHTTLQECESSDYSHGRIEAVVNDGRFQVYTSHLQRMKSEWYCEATMDNVLELLMQQSGSTRFSSSKFGVIPTCLASKWFYKGIINDIEMHAKYAISCLGNFIAAVNVHSSLECAKLGGEPDHWILFSRGPSGILHVYDSYGKEKEYKILYLQPFFSKFWEKVTGQFVAHKFDDEVWNSSNRKLHSIQQDSNNCGPLVLREAERWLHDENIDISTDPDSCAYYRRRYADLLLESTDLEKLMRYCVVCNSDICNPFDCKKCDKCHRFVHCNESCLDAVDVTEPFTCHRCQLVLRLRRMQSYGDPFHTTLCEC